MNAERNQSATEPNLAFLNYVTWYKNPLYGCSIQTENSITRDTVMILSFWTDTPGQTVQTQIRQLLYQGLHCLPFRLHCLDSLVYGRAT